jgi:hypothetical protein
VCSICLRGEARGGAASRPRLYHSALRREARANAGPADQQPPANRRNPKRQVTLRAYRPKRNAAFATRSQGARATSPLSSILSRVPRQTTSAVAPMCAGPRKDWRPSLPHGQQIVPICRDFDGATGIESATPGPTGRSSTLRCQQVFEFPFACRGSSAKTMRDPRSWPARGHARRPGATPVRERAPAAQRRALASSRGATATTEELPG